MSEWFASWFDTVYYHILYKERDFQEAEQFISNLFQYLNPGLDAKVLDLACGKGRHAVFVNSLGYDTTGVDLSENSIAQAKQFENDNLRFFTHDMRDELPAANYDVVLNLFTSFGYFERKSENLSVMRSIEKTLKPDGFLIIDFLNAHHVASNLVKEATIKRGELTFKISKEIKDEKVIKQIRFQDQGKAHHYKEQVQLLNLDDFNVFLRETNLTIQAVFGNYQLDPFHEDAERLIIIAKK
jgi:SAM-dependent methyltransferase